MAASDPVLPWLIYTFLQRSRHNERDNTKKAPTADVAEPPGSRWKSVLGDED